MISYSFIVSHFPYKMATCMPDKQNFISLCQHKYNMKKHHEIDKRHI